MVDAINQDGLPSALGGNGNGGSDGADGEDHTDERFKMVRNWKQNSLKFQWKNYL
jgi:hypothetical protein